MKIAFELTALELDHGGTARAIERLQAELERDRRIDLLPLRQPPSGGGRIARGLLREGLYFPRRLPRAAVASGADLLHCPAAVSPGRCKLPLAITIHDAIAWRHPEWLGRANVLHQRTLVKHALQRADAVITSSQHSRRDLIEHAGVSEDRIVAIPLGVDERFTPGEASDTRLAALGVTRPYLLTVGTLQPRKNLETALAAFERLSPEHPELTLVIAGSRGWRDDELVERLSRSAVHDRIVRTGQLADAELIELYRGARCFLMPSRYEGFGLPPLEAMACGAPVVASDASSLPEVVGDAAVLVAPDDIDGFAAAGARILGDDAEYESLRARGLAHAAGFTWAKTADATVAVYERLLGR